MKSIRCETQAVPFPFDEDKIGGSAITNVGRPGSTVRSRPILSSDCPFRHEKPGPLAHSRGLNSCHKGCLRLEKDCTRRVLRRVLTFISCTAGPIALLASIWSGGRGGGAERAASGGGGVQNVGYKSHVLAAWGVPGKSGQIRGLVAPAEAGYK